MALRRLGTALRSVLPIAPQQSLLALSSASLRRFGGAASHHDDHDDHEEHGPAETPTVFDKLITLNVIDINGRRHAVRSLVGKTLVEALVEAGFPEVRCWAASCMRTHRMRTSSCDVAWLATCSALQPRVRGWIGQPSRRCTPHPMHAYVLPACRHTSSPTWAFTRNTRCEQQQ